jgi:hypothetical protein
MIRLGRSGWVLVWLLVPCLGCDSTEPDQDPSQVLTIEIFATAAIGETVLASTFDVWTLIEDSDSNGSDDDGVTHLWCQNIDDDDTVSLITVPRIPWRFAFKASIVRAGEKTPVVVSAPASFEDAIANTALYDTTSPDGSLGAQPIVAGVQVSDNQFVLGSRTFKFLNRRTLSAANRSVMAATSNPLADILGAPLGQGLCSLSFPGEPQIDGRPQPFTVELNKGDSLIIEARKALQEDMPAEFSLVLRGQQPDLAATVLVDGRPFQNFQGTTAASRTPGDGFSFTYTAR